MNFAVRSLALIAGLSLALTACSPATGPNAGPTTNRAAASVSIEDNSGPQTVKTPPSAVVATDNRTFETLQDWQVKLKAAPKLIMPSTISYKSDNSVIDLGRHTEPKLESVVAAQPDLIINGQRFVSHEAKLKELAPQATLVNLDPREDKPLGDELKRQVTELGKIFGKQAEAEKLAKDFDSAQARVKAAYRGESTLAVNTSGGKIGFIAPKVGRTLGPVYEMLGLKPALEVGGSSGNHMGDDVSVEAIAKSNPAWILVMDRDAAITADQPDYKPAKKLIEGSPALQNVDAVKNGRVVYMPNDTYTNEGIQTYTEFLNSFADALEGKR